MKMKKSKIRDNMRLGAALIIAMVFIVLFATLAVSLVSMSGSNIQIASNQRKLALARASADSGLEFIRYWLGGVCMPGTTIPANRFATMCHIVKADLQSAGIDAMLGYADDEIISLNIAPVVFDAELGQSFTAVIRKTNSPDILEVDITGNGQNIGRTIRVNYNFGTRAHSVFDFGVATRGPLSLSGNIQLDGVNISVESDVYIESPNDLEALSIIGNSQIAGSVKIVNPDAYVTLQGGKAGIGGETGENAIDNHVTIGVPPTEFPMPLPNYFYQYVEGDIDMNDTVHTNVRIPPNTNPSFSAGTSFRGVLFIETPNVVSFTGHVSITGMVVGNGSIDDDSGTNSMTFLGTVDSYPVTDLPETAYFENLRNEKGTFLMAPGFSATFGGNFETLNGVIAANGIEFFGNAGGVINGSVVNYANTPMTLSGNSDLQFNRTGLTEVPAGFGPEIILHYIPSSYTEILDI